ncbi:MAG TPA: glycosyltransferase family 2 protein [Proteobacteria bacterium]|nr:glycosyltransferase family 2 protein [Pseudomonadota bacterium]
MTQSPPAAKPLTGIVFSKDRALQLDGTLNTFADCCREPQMVSLNIIYKTSAPQHMAQYLELRESYPEHNFIEEKNFRDDFLSLCRGAEYLLFLVDDNIFVQPFSPRDLLELLENHPEALGFSLRLGENNNYFYMADQNQTVPPLSATKHPEIFTCSWTSGTGDFAFPLEISSSIYRKSDLWPFLSRIEFANPNSLEYNLAPFRHRFRDLAPRLLIYRQSRTFCNPINIVNTVCRCRAGERREYSSVALQKLFADGFRLDGKRYLGFIPNACHQEVELHLKRLSPTTWPATPGGSPQAERKPANLLSDARQLKKIFLQQGLQTEAAGVYDKYLQTHPTDQELVKLFEYWENAALSATSSLPRIPRITVIIPAYNCAPTIGKSLDSVLDAFAFCAATMPIVNPGDWAEIIVVNDNSADETAQVVENHAAAPYQIKLINQHQNLGAGPCRNLGAEKARGELIFFLDGDDLFFEEHILFCLHQLHLHPELHFIQTGIRIDENILPHWQQAIENSVPFNFCIRKWCHDCLGGYPEGEAFQALRCEDAFYRSLLSRFFLGGRIKRKTMQHFRYPGNALDRQLEKFSRPPTATCSEEILSPAEAAAFPAIKQLMAKKTAELKKNFTRWAEKIKQTT